MSEVADGSELKEADKAAEGSKRKTLTMGDRTKVIDCLRGRVEPFTAESNQAIASLVSEASKVDISWQQLKYMIDDESMAEYKLGEKVHLKLPLNLDDQAQALEARVVQLEEQMVQVTAAMLELTKRVTSVNPLL